MIKKVILMYLFIFTFGFAYMFIAALDHGWFYTFGWFVLAVAMGAFIAKFPVPIMHRWVGIIIQFFALFIPIKFLMIINDAGIMHFPPLTDLKPLLILGQLYLAIVVLIVSFSVVVWLTYRKEKKMAETIGTKNESIVKEDTIQKVSS